MVGKYFRQPFTMLKQTPLFSSLCVVGIGLAISMVMMLAILYYVKLGEIYPETNRSRMLIASAVHMQKIENNAIC